jgi:hypothetical protein
MYSIIGTVVDCSILCWDCTSKFLTDDEIRYLKFGPDKYPRRMKTYPAIGPDGIKCQDESGDYIELKNVTLPHDYRVLDDYGNDVYPLSELDCSDHVEGEYCSECGECLREPYELHCYECFETVASGQNAVDLERSSTNEDGFRYDEIFCGQCRQRYQQELLKELLERVQQEHDRLNVGPLRTFLGLILGVDKAELDKFKRMIERITTATNIVSLRKELTDELMSKREVDRSLLFTVINCIATIEDCDYIDINRINDLEVALTK